MNVLVIGLAKTGTTIISKTIEKSISGDIEYHLEPKTIIFFEQEKFNYSKKSHVVKIIFEHWNLMPYMRSAICHNESLLKFDKIVCIERDIRDEIISRFMYKILPFSKKNIVTNEQIKIWTEWLKIKEINPKKYFIYIFSK
jgi:hypothetical protein